MPPQRVLIVSANELFGQGLRRLLAPLTEVEVVGIATDLDTATELVEQEHPQIVIADYGGEAGLWQHCLARFFRREVGVERVVLLTLGEQGQHAVVYHRFMCPAEAVETWLFGGGEQA